MRKSALLVALAINLFFLVLVATAAFSWGYYGTITLDGLTTAGSLLFGGLPTLLWSLFWFALFAAVLWFIYRLAVQNKNGAAAAVAGVAIVIAGFGLWQLTAMPYDQVGVFITLLVVAAILTALMWVVLVRSTSTLSVPSRARYQAWRNARAANRSTVVP